MSEYMSVYDLTQEELNELKWAYWDDDTASEIIQGEYDSPLDLPNDIIYDHYYDYMFVEEDFWCNIKNNA